MAGTLLGIIEFLLFSGLRHALGDRGFGSYPGWIMVVLSIAMIPVMTLAAKQVDRARNAYALLALGGAAGQMAFLDAGLRLFGAWAPPKAGIWVALLMILGTLSIPVLAHYEGRARWNRLLSDGKRWRILRNQGSWDPSTDGQSVRGFNRSPPTIARLLLMIAPALGLNLQSIVGKDIALAVAATLGAILPYWILHITLTSSIARIRLMSKIEQELGRPLLLAENGKVS